ncbi:hypothetical protein, variant 3 [Aphanomyces astaci]|nr:hypothetical protein, variant 3 [Aphanomyces astaci]ETV84029.1 hypothetical protein, variant 3 [Aphanomyces astaci]|eukprot:XP_009825721.1 hypothetical protein, variant 3 [Aphanomyces astaci]
MGPEPLAQLNDLASVGGISVLCDLLHPTDPQDVQIHVLMVLANSLALYNAVSKSHAADSFTQSGACQPLIQCLSSGVEDLELQSIRTMFHLCKAKGTTGQDALRRVGATVQLCELLSASSDASVPVKMDATKCLHVYMVNNPACRDEVVGHNGLTILVQTLLLLTATSPDADVDVVVETLLLCLESEFVQQYPIERAFVAPLFGALQPHFVSEPATLTLTTALVAADHARYAAVCATLAGVMDALVLCLDEAEVVSAAALKVLRTMCPVGACQPSVARGIASANGLVRVLQWLAKITSVMPVQSQDENDEISFQEDLLTILNAFCSQVEYVGDVVGYQGVPILLALFTYQPRVLELSARAIAQLAKASPAVLNELIPFGASQGFEQILGNPRASVGTKESALVFYTLMGERSSDIILSAAGAVALFGLVDDRALHKLALGAIGSLTGGGYNHRSTHRLELQHQVVASLYGAVLHPLLVGGTPDLDVLTLALQVVRNTSHISSAVDLGVVEAVVACLPREVPGLAWDVLVQCLQCAAATAWTHVGTLQAVYRHILTVLIDQPDSNVIQSLLRCLEIALAHPGWKTIFVAWVLSQQQMFIDFCEALGERLDRAYVAPRPGVEVGTLLAVVSALCRVRRLVPLLLQADLHVSVLNGLKSPDDDVVDVVLACMQAFLPHVPFQTAALAPNSVVVDRLVHLYSLDNVQAAHLLSTLSQNHDQFPVSTAFVTTLLHQLESSTAATRSLSEHILSHVTDELLYAQHPVWTYIVDTRNLRIVNHILLHITSHNHVLIATIGCGQVIVDPTSHEASTFQEALLQLLVQSTHVKVRGMAVEALATLVVPANPPLPYNENEDVVADTISSSSSFFTCPFARAILSTLPSHPLAVATLIRFALETKHWDLEPFWQQVATYRMRAKFVEAMRDNVHESSVVALSAFLASSKLLKTREVNSLVSVASGIAQRINAQPDDDSSTSSTTTVWLTLMLHMSGVSRLAHAMIDGGAVECMMERLGQYESCQTVLIHLLRYKSATERLLNGHGVARLLSLVDSNQSNRHVLLELLGIVSTIAHHQKAFRVAMLGSLKLWASLLHQSISSSYDVALATLVVQVLASLCELYEIRVQVVVVPDIYMDLITWLHHVATSSDTAHDLILNALTLIHYRVVATTTSSSPASMSNGHDDQDQHVVLDLVLGLAVLERQTYLSVYLKALETMHALWSSSTTLFHDDPRWRLIFEHLSALFLAGFPTGAPPDVQTALLPFATDLGLHRTSIVPNQLLQWLVLSSFDANHPLVFPLLVQLVCTSPSFVLFLRTHTHFMTSLRVLNHPLARRIYVLLGQDVCVALSDHAKAVDGCSLGHGDADDEDEEDEGAPDTSVGFVDQDGAASSPESHEDPSAANHHDNDNDDQALWNNLPPNTTTTGAPQPTTAAPTSVGSAPFATFENHDQVLNSRRSSSASTPYDATGGYSSSTHPSSPAAAPPSVAEDSVTCRHCSGVVTVPPGVLAYLDTVPCPHCHLPLGSTSSSSSAAASDTKTVSCTQCSRPLHLPDGLDLPEVMCPYCNAINKLNRHSSPPPPPTSGSSRPKTMKCGYCSHTFLAQSNQPTIQCPKCTNVSRVEGFDSMIKVNCASCGTLLALPAGVKSYKCMKCAHVQK